MKSAALQVDAVGTKAIKIESETVDAREAKAKEAFVVNGNPLPKRGVNGRCITAGNCFPSRRLLGS